MLTIRRRSLMAVSAMTVIGGAARADDRDITGAGTAFVTARVKLWIRQVQRSIKANFVYEGIGNHNGLSKLLANEADYTTTDLPLSEEKLAEAGLYQFLIGYGGLVPIINVPGIASEQLVLNGEILAGFYGGVIKKWNDPKIAALNAGVTLPDLDVRPFHLGAPGAAMQSITHHFTQYLLATNPDWRAKYGPVITKRWAVGSMVPIMETMADNILAIPGSIGYMPAGRAKAERMVMVKLPNAAGKLVTGSFDAVSATVARASGAGTGGVPNLINLPGPDSWPIVLPSYAVLPRQPKNPERAALVAAFFKNAITNGGPVSERLACVHPRPDEQAAALKLLEQMTG